MLTDELELLYTESGPERVGFILKDGTIREVKNVSEHPEDNFEPEELYLDFEDDIVASWHTHPGDTCGLSYEDDQGFKSRSEWAHYIIGEDGVQCYIYDKTTGAILNDS